MTELKALITHNLWITGVFFVVLLTMVAHSVEALIYRRLYPRLRDNNRTWDHSLLYAMHPPLGLAIWILGLTFAANIVESVMTKSSASNLLSMVGSVSKIGLVLSMVWFLMRFISALETNLIESNTSQDVDKTLVTAVCQLVRVSIIITGTLIVMQMLEVDTKPLIAFGSVGAAGIAFASKDLLGNFFGGLMIYLDRPFSIGDWVRSPDKNIEGTVEYIGWRTTRIRTFDKRPLYVPNGLFLVISVENPSRMLNRRIKTNIGLRYQDATKVGPIINDVEAMLRAHDEIDTNQTLIVNLVEFGPSSLNFMVYTFTKTTNWVKFQAVQQDVFLKIIEIIEQHGAECAFPTQTVHIPDGIASVALSERVPAMAVGQ